MVYGGAVRRLLGLALGYVGVVVTEGLVKLLMQVYRGRIGAKASRALRLATSALVASAPQHATAKGVGVALIVAESDPIGEFVGLAASELVLHAGILLRVFGYMIYLRPWLALGSRWRSFRRSSSSYR
jgi:hypothetical protein